MQTNTIKRIVEESLAIVNDYLPEKLALDNMESIKIFGQGGLLDSISLVKLIVTIEEKLEDECGINIILANDKAMSSHNSPFASVERLVSFIDKLIAEEAAHA